MEKKNKKSHLEEIKQGWQRTQADFDNYKKRTEKEKQDWSTQTKTDILSEFLPILDNLTIAISHTPQELINNSWVIGLHHIEKQIQNSLSEQGIERISPKENDQFDPYLHEAIAIQSVPNLKPNSIISIQSAGYKIGEKLIRPAKVVVNNE